eukprot:TRINITY_DN1541_c0_g2_i2.p1 TRINITY_DN1541_c0_g2~~TRINITY_DN1541_c0_g2_i2.p1  ORF type:complete len:180 (-),score=45.32 TRINITY_DN1541_c0_g2_i2:214-753(-)
MRTSTLSIALVALALCCSMGAVCAQEEAGWTGVSPANDAGVKVTAVAEEEAATPAKTTTTTTPTKKKECKTNGSHKFGGLENFACETCKYLLTPLLNTKGKFQEVCDRYREAEFRARENRKGAKVVEHGLPFSAMCQVYMVKHGQKIKTALSPLEVCKRMGKCSGELSEKPEKEGPECE